MYTGSVLAVNLTLLLWSCGVCHGLRIDTTLQESIIFWTEAVCKVPTTKTVYFHGIFRDTSTTLHNYFETLMQGIGDLCDVAVLSKMYREPTANVTTRDYQDSVLNANATSTPPKGSTINVQRRSGLLREILVKNLLQKPAGVRKIARINYGSVVDMWNINIIFLEDHKFFKNVLDAETPFVWTRQEHFLVFAIWSKEFQQREKDNERVIVDILRKFWQEYRIHNVFFNEPLTGHVHRGYTYNPIARAEDADPNDIIPTWGRLEIIDTSSQFELFSTLAHLTRQRTRDLDGRQLKVSLFQTDTLRKTDETTTLESRLQRTAGYSGMDAIIMATMSKHMNFRVVEVAPAPGMRFGHQMENGTYTGAIADIANHVVDVCFVSFFVKRYGTMDMDIMDFSTYVDFDKVCVIVPKANKIPKGLRIYHIFQPSVWCFVILSQLLLQFAWYFIQILSVRREGKVDFQLTMLKAFLVYTGYAMKLPRSTTERMILLGIFLGSITLMGTFNGLLYKSFAKDIYYKDINRLSELAESEMPILVNSPSMNDLFGSGDDPEEPIMSKLRRKMVYGHSSLQYTAFDRNASTLMRQYTFPLVKEVFVDKDGTRLIHLVPECPGYYYLSYVLPKDSILFPRFVALLGRLNQAGLTELWKKRTLVYRARKLKVNIEIPEHEESSDFIAFTLSDTQTCFTFLAVGLAMSFLAFLNETGWLKRCFRREIKLRPASRPNI